MSDCLPEVNKRRIVEEIKLQQEKLIKPVSRTPPEGTVCPGNDDCIGTAMACDTRIGHFTCENTFSRTLPLKEAISSRFLMLAPKAIKIRGPKLNTH